MTKKEAKANRAAWALARAERRVVKFTDTLLMSFPTVEMRDAAIAKAVAGGLSPLIVDPA